MNTIIEIENKTSLHEYCKIYGESNSNAINMIMLSPVSHVWSGGDFCEQLLNNLVASGYKIYVIDSIFFLNNNYDDELSIKLYIESLIDNIVLSIKEHIQKDNIDIIAGYALGGTIAMKIAKYFPNNPKILSISAPAYVDDILNYKINALLHSLMFYDLQNALSLLAQYVSPINYNVSSQHMDIIPSGTNELEAKNRMINGFKFLLQLDVRQDICNYLGKALCIIGEKSQLATLNNQAFTHNSINKNIAIIPHAGMRVLKDNYEYTLYIIKQWLNNE